MKNPTHAAIANATPFSSVYPDGTYLYEPMEKIYVVAGNYNQFRDYCTRKGTVGNDNKQYLYVERPDSLRGLGSIKGVYIGTWRNRPDIKEIEQRIAIIKRMMREREDAKREAAAQRMINDKIDKMAEEMQKEIDQEVMKSFISQDELEHLFNSKGYTAGAMPKSSETVSTISIQEYIKSLKA
jgi:hypothetical protein